MRRAIPAIFGLAWVLFLVRGSVGAAPDEPAGPVQLVHDFFPGEFEDGRPLPQFTRLGSALFFVADDRETGQAVWRTDGTAAGTRQVPVAGVSGSFEGATILGTLGGRILWLAGPSAVPGETALLAAGEDGDGALLASFNSGARPKILGGRLYFLRCADTGCAVWSTDGTAAGTAPVPALAGRNADARALETLADRWLIFWDGPALLAYDLKRNELLPLLETGAPYVDLYPVGETLFVRTFIPDNNLGTVRLWASRLDAPRARLLFTSQDVGVAGWRDGRLYFAPYNGRLWSTDGRPEGTFPYSGVRVESFSLLADQLGPVGTKTLIPMPGYYWAGLLAADETKRELSVVLPVCSGKYYCLGSGQSAVTVAGGLGFEEVNGLLARSDGTPEGTALGSGLRYVDPKTFSAMDGRLVLGARREGIEQLWETDGTAAGTRSLSDGTRDRPFRVQGPPISYNGALFAAAERKPVGQQIWRIESGRTTPMTDLRHLASGVDPVQAFPAGDRVILEGTAIYGWVGVGGDGAVEALPDFENPCDRILSPDACPNPPLQVGGRLLFGKASEEDLSRSLWSTDGTAAGTGPVQDADGEVPGAAALGRWGDRAIVLDDGGGVWSSDGDPAGGGTRLLAQIPTDLDHLDQYRWISPPVELGSSALLFRRAPGDGGAVLEVWRTDGTRDGTLLLTSTPFRDNFAAFLSPAVVGGRLFFRFGGTIWMSDGSPAGTHPLPEQPSGGTFALAAGSGILYAGAGYFEDLESLWAIDPTTLTPRLLGRFTTVGGAYIGWPLGSALGDTLFFQVTGPRGGSHAWLTEGTSASTHPLQGPLAALQVGDFLTVGDRRCFLACDAGHGCELWSTDRLGETVQRITDVWPGPRSSDPTILWAGDSFLLLAATGPTVGRELWRLDLTALARQGAAPAPALARPLVSPWREPARKAARRSRPSGRRLR